MVLVCSESSAEESLKYGIGSSCVHKYATNRDKFADESDTSSTSISNNDAAGWSSSSRINTSSRIYQEITDGVFNYNNLIDSKTDPVVKKVKRNPIPKFINDNRKHLQKFVTFRWRYFKCFSMSLEKIFNSSEI